MRSAFITSLCEVAKSNKRIFLLTGDLGFGILEPFADQFPNRFLNVGVAEANLVTVAAGLSTMGFIPFIYSIATFITMRPFEQIRNDVALQNLNVKIIGVGGGLAYGKAGPTHHSFEDVALMRLLPHMVIVSPVDPQEVYAATKEVALYKGPVYLRFEHNPETFVYGKPPAFSIGKANVLEAGKDIVLLATGAKVATAIMVSTLLKKQGINIGVVAFPTINPLDGKLLNQLAKRYKLFVTIEEHAVDGGFGSAIEDFTKNTNSKVVKFALKNTFLSTTGDYEALIAHHGLTPEKIAGSIYDLCKKI